MRRADVQEEALSGEALWRRMDSQLLRAAALANCVGALVVSLFLIFLLPVTPDVGDPTERIARNAGFGTLYLAIGLVLGTVWARRRGAALLRWLRAGRPPTEEERDLALRGPLVNAGISATFWVGAALFFTLLNLDESGLFASTLGVTVLLGGVTTSAMHYLLAERVLRPLNAHALAGGLPPRPILPGVATRLTMSWALATGVSLLGIAAIAVAELAGADIGRETLAGSVLFLAAVALAVGLVGIRFAARSVAEPVGAVRTALSRVEEGDFDARVPVDDGSEIGLLEAGFNRMAEGLAEREHLRDLFGRHVGREVAHSALAGDVQLGGEVRETAVLFVDLVGSTALAARRPPEEVVGLLNAFFRLVVDAAERHGGWVNKFEGDAALCVFGAPNEREDPAGDALAAARALRARMAEELPDVDAGIGVSAGRAVAGNVGAEQRYEYTVIGDPVNEAARLCELAKKRPERLLASEAAVSRAQEGEARHWSLGEVVELRGRAAGTRLATVAA